MKKYVLLIILILCFSISYADEKPRVPDSEIPWRVIISWYPGEPDTMSEDFGWFLMDLEEHFIELPHFYMDYIFINDDMIVKINIDEDVIEIDISDFAGEMSGYIFAMQGKDPVWCDYKPSFESIAEAEEYFFE